MDLDEIISNLAGARAAVAAAHLETMRGKGTVAGMVLAQACLDARNSVNRALEMANHFNKEGTENA